MTVKAEIISGFDRFRAEFSFESSSDRIGVLGESGAGKSILLKFLAGISDPDRGEIWLDGRCLYSTEKKINIRPQDRNIAYMFQNYALFPAMSVRQNIEIVVRGSREEKKEKADRLLSKFHIEDLAERKPAELSGGQQQRVALARVLAYEPEMILLDEPFSALDQGLKEILQMELEDMLQDYRGKVIMVSHSMEELYKFSKELIVVSDGRIVEMGDKHKLFHSPATVRAARLLGVKNILKVKQSGDNQVKICEWNMTVDTGGRDAAAIEQIGIRDEGLIPVWEMSAEPDGNLIEIEISNVYETMNQVKIFFYVNGSEGEKEIYTTVIGRKEYEMYGLPERLKIDCEKLIFFEYDMCR